MVTVPQTLERVKRDLAQLLTPEAIRQACYEHQHRWRERILDPVTTIHFFIQQVLHGNTACIHLRHLTGQSITAPAYCLARQRLRSQCCNASSSVSRGYSMRCRSTRSCSAVIEKPKGTFYISTASHTHTPVSGPASVWRA